MPLESERSILRQEMGERGVLGICLDVHMTATGSCERPRAEQERDVELLNRLLQVWEQSHPRCGYFDSTVRGLVLAALFEADAKDAP